MIKKLFLSISLSLIAVLSAMPLAFAAGASISLVANKATVPVGGSLIVAVYMNGGGTAINAIEADLNYSASKLQYVGVNFGGGVFEIGAAASGGNGAVNISRGTISPVSGSGLVATVTFKALSGSGSAAIGISGSSSLVDANSNAAVAYASNGVSVNFGAGSVSSSTSNTTAVDTAPVAPKDTTPPVISSVKVTKLSPYGATITWTTSEASDSAIDFGVDTNYGLSASSSDKVLSHSVALASAFLNPETLLHYRVKSTDAAGNVATGTDQSFQLPGVPVTIIVRGANGKALAGASVTLDGATDTSDSKGIVVLPSSLGNKKVTTNYQGVTVQKPITVSRSSKPLPPVQLDLSRQPLNGWMIIAIGLFVVVLALLAIDAFLFGSHFFSRFAGLHLPHHTPAPTSPVPSERPIKAEHPTSFDFLSSHAPAPTVEKTTDADSVIRDVSPPQTAEFTLSPSGSPGPVSIQVTDDNTNSSASIAPRLKKATHHKAHKVTK